MRKDIKSMGVLEVLICMAKKKNSQALAIVALILNVIILPGLGSLIGGRVLAGILQMVFSLLGLGLVVGGAIFSIFLIGIPFLIAGLVLMFSMWVWSIVTGVRLIQESEE